jgi:hypothetical protein
LNKILMKTQRPSGRHTRLNSRNIIIFSFIIISVVIGSGVLFLRQIDHWFFGDPDIVKAEKSPNGKYTAYACITNGGATTDFGVTLTVLKTNEKLMWDTKANVFNAYHTDCVDFSWTKDNQLIVSYGKDASIISQKTIYKDIGITYQDSLPQYTQ